MDVKDNYDSGDLGHLPDGGCSAHFLMILVEGQAATFL
jgi:hypothetical protein